LQWLCGLAPISHRTLSGFRSECKGALDDRFVQVLGMMSAEGLITLERVTVDGTKIKANAGGNTFRRKQKLKAHLELAREQVRVLNAQAEEAEKTAKRQAAARRRVARQRASRLEAAVREVERLQEEKKHDRKQFVARASSTDPDAHVMRNGEVGTVPSYNVQLLTDTRHGIVVNVEASIDAIDYRQLASHRALRNDAGRQAGNRSWPMATTPTTRRCERPQLVASTFMDRGKTVGSRWTAMRKAAGRRSWPARFLTMPGAGLLHFVPPDRSCRIRLC
jgi:hypothetical protein